MKLIIREYLSLLKESNELDALLSDLILTMDIEPLSKPQRGVRQYGVDLAGVGVDPEDGIKKVFLFVVKQKDIDRSSWGSGPQAVRPSLDEIFDVYLQTMLDVSNNSLPKKIIVTTNGDLTQAVQMNWKFYTDEKTKLGEIEFDFWGGDKLSLLIEKYLFNEFLFPPFVQSYLRKTLAFIDMNDYDLSHYYQLIEEILFRKEAQQLKEKLKVLRLLHLSLNVIFQWSQNANNLKPAFLSAERVTLRVWEWLYVYSLFEDKKIVTEFSKIEATRYSINNTYFNKIQPYCYVRDGLTGYGADEIEYPLLTFEQIGILGTIGLNLIYRSFLSPEEEHYTQLQYAQITANALVNLIQNNRSSLYPLFDEHVTDIGLGFMLLYFMGKKDELHNWLFQLIDHIILNFKFNEKFPLFSDSYDELVDVQLGNKGVEINSSTLLPVLLEWIVVLNDESSYIDARGAIKKLFPQLNLQIWYPDETTEPLMYHKNALFESGSMRYSIELPDSFTEFQRQIISETSIHGVSGNFSFLSKGYPIIGLVSSRHYRTPIFPVYWRQLIKVGNEN